MGCKRSAPVFGKEPIMYKEYADIWADVPGFNHYGGL
nr:MAG TPA: hypothetical protein [Caudoviricetes sp.]